MACRVAFVLGLVVVVLLQHAAAQTVHVVGDATGWTVPQGGPTFYSNWAAKKNFVVGDSLTFKFETNAHDVLEVTKESFDACNSDDAIGNVIKTGPATVKLGTAGIHYYICTVGSHCLGGQKLSITVSATPNGGSAVPPSHGHDDACAPTPAKSPSSSPPNRGGSQSAPAPASSSSAVIASIYVTLSAIVMSLF